MVTKPQAPTLLSPHTTGDKFRFMMVNPERNAAAVEWMYANSHQPRQANRLWARCLVVANPFTGEVLASRQGLARDLGITPTTVSQIMGELVRANVLIRQRIDGHNHYYINPLIATGLPKGAREKAQALAPELITAA